MFQLFLTRKLKYLYRKYDWFSIIAVLLVLHCISAVLMLVFDYGAYERDTFAETLWAGTWWFFVTATTVGYGDIVPQTIPGQIVAILDMLFGIGLMYTVIGAGADKLIQRRRIRMKGLKQLKLKNHIVVLGGGAERKVKKLIEGIRHDSRYQEDDIVVCSDCYDENPFIDEIEFVRGGIGEDDTMKRACVTDAKVIIIYGYTDEETILATLAVDALNRAAFTTAYIRDRSNIKYIDRINTSRHVSTDGKSYMRIRVITRINDLMLAREISNPGLSDAMLELMDSSRGNTFFSIEAWPEKELDLALPQVRQLLRATDAHALLVGIKRYEDGSLVMNPTENTVVKSRDHLFVIAEHRPEIEWTDMFVMADGSTSTGN